MSEHMAEAEPHKSVDKYERERKAADAMEFFLERGHQLYQLTFMSEQKRDARFNVIEREFAERQRDTPEIHSYAYEVGGATAMMANMRFESTDEDEEWLKVGIARSREAPMKPFPPLGTARVWFDSVVIRKGMEVNEAGGVYYYARPELNFISTQSVTLQDHTGGRPLQFDIQVPVVVPCDGRNEISVPVIERLKTRASAIGQIALKPENKRLVGTLYKLASAMEAEKDTFVEFKKPRILHEIAKQGAGSDVDHDTLATAIRAAFGTNRRIRVEGELYFHNDPKGAGTTAATGAIVDVLPHNPITAANELTLVIEEGSGLKYAPLSKVKRLEY